MFTGIVQGVGTVVSLHAGAAQQDLVIESALLAPRLAVGASVALDGVCQTVTELSPTSFTVHAMAETLRVTTLGSLRPGSRLNLELSLAAGAEMGGHFVLGHVDGLAKIQARESMGSSEHWRFSANEELVRQMVPKGSVALDGISLTLGPKLSGTSFEVFLIPHTLSVTTLGEKRVGDAVNLETDILGKYLRRYLSQAEPSSPGLDWDTLRRTGFAE